MMSALYDGRQDGGGGAGQAHDVERLERGYNGTNNAGMMAKYFAASLAMRTWSGCRARHEQLFADAARCR